MLRIRLVDDSRTAHEHGTLDGVRDADLWFLHICPGMVNDPCCRIVSFAFRRSVPFVMFGIAAAFCALFPFAQVFPLYQSVAERYAYTASIGIVMAVVALVRGCHGGRPLLRCPHG